MKTKRMILLLLMLGTMHCAAAQPDVFVQRIYTKPDAADTSGIEGKVDMPLTHALAMCREFKEREGGTFSYERCYRGELSDGDRAFRFPHVAVGKYDLVLINQDSGLLYEGLQLGDPATLPPVSRKNLDVIVGKQDGFFNRFVIMRFGIREVEEGGAKIVKMSALIERLRDKVYLTQGGDVVKAVRSGREAMAFVRRFEVMELEQAKDDWQIHDTRHIYREAESSEGALPRFKHVFVSALGNIRVINSVKSLGEMSLPAK